MKNHANSGKTSLIPLVHQRDNPERSRRSTTERAETIPQGSRGQVASKRVGSIKWRSRTFPCCVQCGGQDSQHAGRGLCRRCYSAVYATEQPDRIRALARASYWRNREKRLDQMRVRWSQNEELRTKTRIRTFAWKYNGNGLKALERAGFKCEICGYNKIRDILEVHHRDGNRKNNTMENLEIRCPNCHKEHHYGS